MEEKRKTVSKPQIRCEEVLQHLMAYLDHEIDAAMSAEIERHLQDCRGCFSRAEFERQLKERVHNAGAAEAPDRLRTRIRKLVEQF